MPARPWLILPLLAFSRPAGSLSLLSRPSSRRAASPRCAAASSEVDVAVVGGGPAAYTIAALLARDEHSVALIDPTPERAWPNNYGSWRVEWEALAARLQLPELLDCVATDWRVTDCFFGGSFDTPFDDKLRLDRAYLQVDRALLKAALQKRHAEGGVQLMQGSVQASTVSPNLFDANLVHDAAGSSLTLSGGEAVRAKLVVDATGFESRMVRREASELWTELTPGYQIAYGMKVDVEGSIAPYAEEAMTLFDYRTDHLQGTDMLDDAEDRPSFVYVMPYGEGAKPGTVAAFFEETSLVGRDERRLEFPLLKRRLLARLAFHGISYDPDTVREEEYCYIPMGGELPDPAQRVVPFGGAANTVHPATGYQLCRMLCSSTDVAAALSAELKRADFDPDAAAAAGHAALWPRAARLQRDFAVFGGEFLGSQPVEILRGFFSAFFALDEDVWGGFLAGWPGLPGNEYHGSYLARLKFGISIFFKFPPKVAATFVGYLAVFTAKYGPLVLRSIFTPVFELGPGAPSDEGLREARARAREVYVTGDSRAKFEAVAMLRESGAMSDGEPRGEPSPQVALLEEEELKS